MEEQDQEVIENMIILAIDTITTSTIQIAEIDGSGGQDTGGNRKHD